jgi:Lipase maturation factor
LVVWGLFPRGLGLVFLISFSSLSGQVVWGSGERAGLASVSRRLAKMRDDFPTWKRFLYFPTLLWLNESDAMLRALTWVGIASACLVIYGGPIGFWALLACYVCYLSLDTPMGLIFPWDCLLLESTLLALFLPHTQALPHVLAVSAPAPVLCWAYRLLVFRVMFGFGKQKFLGSRPKDSAYLKGFLINQPLLSPLAWYTQKLPTGLLKPGVTFMFLAEIPVPFFAFFPGWASLVCAAFTVGLMIGIQLMGSFGFFSMVTTIVCLPLLDNITPRLLHVSQLFAAGQPILTNAYVLLHTCGAAVVFVFNSWTGQSWSLWSLWYRFPIWIQPMFGFFRWVHPFRWLHPYGVFPPNNQPGVKISLLLEVSWDREHWHELSFDYAPSNPKSRPRFVSPHHPRGDQAVIYDTFGLNPTSLVSGMLGPWDPYFFAAKAPAVAFCQSVLEPGANELIDDPEFRRHPTPPIAARITTIMLEPVSLEQHRATGDYWKRTYIGPHVPTHAYDPDFWEDVHGEPELWHFESILWRRRSRFKQLIDLSLAGKTDPMQMAIWDGRLTTEDVERFWHELIPMVSAETRTTFDTVPALVSRVRARFDRRQRRIFQRLVGRFSLILVARLEPLYLYRLHKTKVRAQTYFHLWMLAQHIIAQGKDVYLAALAQPEAECNAQLQTMTTQSGLYLMSIFRFEEMCFEAQKLRLITSYVHPHDPKEKLIAADKLRHLERLPELQRKLFELGRSISGFLCVMDDIREGFRGPECHHGFPELYPTYEELDSGEIRVVAYGKPSPDVELAPDLKSVPS